MKKKKKASSNRLLFFGSISTIIIFTFIATFIGFIIEVKNLNQEQIRIKSQISLQKDEEDYLKNEIVKLKDHDYLARYARENYMYSKDGEYIIRVPEQEKKEEVTHIEPDNKFLISSIIVGSLLILIIVLRKIF